METPAPDLVPQARKASLAARRDPRDAEVLDWIESLADTSGWKA
jgi:hypothetical protein